MLSENENSKYNFEKLREQTRLTTARGDVRPIFIIHFFERLDESEDFLDYVNAISAFGRQVLIAIRCTDQQSAFYREKFTSETFKSYYV